MKVRFTAVAIRQIADIIDRIAREDPHTADRFSEKIVRLTDLRPGTPA